ncbi:MAG: hypothetical protein R3B60_03185 [Candidatus Paceibacterota bacterium]
MITTNFINFSTLNKTILITLVTFLFLVSFGLFNIATAEAGALLGYDKLNTKLNSTVPEITELKIQFNFGLVPDNFNSVAVVTRSTLPYVYTASPKPMGFSYKINNTVIDIPPRPIHKADFSRIELTESNGFKAGENEISIRICDFEGCSDWGKSKSITINEKYIGDKVCNPITSNTKCHTNSLSAESKIVDGKVYPYYYTLLNDPINNELRKPNIVSANVPSTIRLGSKLNRFWDWVVTDNDLVNRYQINVNGRISETYKEDIWNVSEVISVFQFNGFKIGDNEVSVRQCNNSGCSPWSNKININVNDYEGRLASSNCWVYLGNTAVTGNHVVKAKSSGTVFSNGPFFSTDSDLGAIATYLGAPVGSIVQLSFSTINTNRDRCGNSYPSTTRSGITTTEYLNQPDYKLNMKVTMTTLCIGNDCEYSGQNYSYTPSSGTANTTTTNNTNNTTTGTTNTTNTTSQTPQPVATHCLGDSAPVSQTVTATTLGSVYGTGPFTTGSNLGKIAAYLGAPAGTRATLSVVDAGCFNNYRSGNNNGVTTIPWYSTWRGMTVTCTSGCGSGTASGNTSNGVANIGNNLSVNNNLSNLSYNELLDLLRTLTDLLNSLLAKQSGSTSITNTMSSTFPSNSIAKFNITGADMPIDVGVNGNIMVVTVGTDGIKVVDISNVSSPKVLSSLKLTDDSMSQSIQNKSRNVFVSGTKAYVTTEYRLFIIDISNPSKPKVLGIAGASKAKSITVAGNYAYIIGSFGLEVWDVSDPTKPSKAGVATLRNNTANGVHISNNVAFVYGGIESPEAFDLRNLSKIVPVTNLQTGPANDVTGGGMYVAVNNGLIVSESVSLTNSIHRSGPPSILGKFTSSMPYKSVEYYSGKVYAATASNLQAVSITDKNNPKLVKTYPVSGALGLTIDNGIAYIPTGFGVTMVKLQ